MRSSSKSRSEKREQRRSVDAYDAALLDAFDAEFLNPGKDKKKEESTHPLGTSQKNKREKRNTFAFGDHPLGSLPTDIDLNKIDLASSMHKGKVGAGGGYASSQKAIFTPYKLGDMVMSENKMERRQQIHSEEIKPSGLPAISSFAPLRPKVETQIETFENSKSTPSFQTPLTLPSSSLVPVTSSRNSNSGRNSILLRLRIGGGTIIAGAVAKDAIEGNNYPFHFYRLSLNCTSFFCLIIHLSWFCRLGVATKRIENSEGSI